MKSVFHPVPGRIGVTEKFFRVPSTLVVVDAVGDWLKVP